MFVLRRGVFAINVQPFIEGDFIMALPTRVQRALVDFPFDGASNDFESTLNRFFGRQGEGFAPYAVDVREDEDHLYVEAELPGYRKDQVDNTLENSTLTISADRKIERKENGKGGELLLNERRHTRFLRSFTLPPTVDGSTVDAKLSDGLLTVTLNKRQESKPRKIAVA
jgi:HSP20 family protein